MKTGFTFRGKEIVLSKTTGRPWSGLVRKGMERGHNRIYPERKRIEVVVLYACVGDPEQVSKLSSVPVSYIKKWRKEDWFKDLLREIREENNDKIDVQFTEIVEKTLEQVKDRLENGDYVQNYKGDLQRKPISAKDLVYLLSINVDKRQTLRGEPTTRTEVVEKLQEKQVDRLEKLAETFENLARFGRKPKIFVGEVTDAVPITETKKISSFETSSNSQEVGEEVPSIQDIAGEKEEIS